MKAMRRRVTWKCMPRCSLADVQTTSWETVATFPPMNLVWAYLGTMYFPSISPGMGKHCDVAHITDPQHRAHPLVGEDDPALGITSQEVSLAFNLMVKPNHRGHIVG